MNNKKWILILILLLVLSLSVPSLGEKIRISGRTIGTNQQVDDFVPDLDSEKGVKIEETKRYIESSPETFTPEKCKYLLKEWQSDIDGLEFRNMGIADQTSVDISGGERTITFIYRDDGSFEGCNVLDTFDINLDRKESEVEKYFDCEKEDCKDHKFDHGRFLYVYEPLGEYNTLKYLLRKNGEPGKGEPSLTFQILYIAKDMTQFIQYRVNAARQGYGCGA